MRDPDTDCNDQHSASRRGVVKGCGVSLAIGAFGLSAEAVAAAPDVADLYEGLPDNWGRWGSDDELGAINFLGSEEMAAGMEAALRNGREHVERHTLQLSITGEKIPATDTDLSLTTGDPEFLGRDVARRDNVQDEQSYDDGEAQPMTGLKFADDQFVNPLYLQGTTHADALGHAWYGEQIYNGFDADSTAETKQFEYPRERCGDEADGTLQTRGLGKADISNAADAGVVGRGVLLDVGRLKGGTDDRLDYEESVTLSDLEATAAAQGVEVRKHDILLIRTGSIARTRDPNAAWGPSSEPGLKFGEDLYRWFHDMEIPYVGADNLAVEKLKQEIDGEEYVAPLHPGFLRNLGVTLNEILWLEGLADACAADGVYDFLFAGAPLHAERSTGGPINPVVLKATEP